MVTTSNESMHSEDRALDVRALRADEWSYLAEGGLHLLVRYAGPTEGPGDSVGGNQLDVTSVERQTSLNRLALRIKKRPHGLSAS